MRLRLQPRVDFKHATLNDIKRDSSAPKALRHGVTLRVGRIGRCAATAGHKRPFSAWSDTGKAIGGREGQIRIAHCAVLAFHRVRERAADEIGSAQQAVEAAVKRREAAKGHLKGGTVCSELCIQLRPGGCCLPAKLLNRIPQIIKEAFEAAGAQQFGKTHLGDLSAQEC